MFALRGLSQARQVARVPRQAAVFQQKRGMAGGEDEDDSMFVNWWDNPTNPDVWHKHQASPIELHKLGAGGLAWWGVAFWGAIFYTAFGGKKKEKVPAAEEVAKA
ncbi:hypothetical protein MNEG_5576 [Monoraphidium neglectum]|uniref:Uncharacterized protein n=1 Tax=Monoraphidium neglectum TaxID=145388 RepID=A0A0D2L5T2_9CHLO|nr:hypothetical protein MNEG_5576 [Monoraphidium neglectum]KIZ02379.1 hypothetical protein MNEG_5576 [Monoraphidium neglectum]|eukprot:XP_013901398.1 hypothetical protein MNEG_5576 [Monoraphidium neglectum]